MRRHTLVSPVAVLAAAFLLGNGRAAVAQEPTEFQAMHLSGWTFTPGIIAAAVFDNNVGLAADLPGQPKQGDQLFIIEPSGQLEYSGPRTTFESGYRGYLRRYSDLDALDGYDQRGYAALRHRATRHVTLFLNNSFMEVPSTDELELNGVPFSRTGSRSNTLAGGVQSRLTRLLDLNVRYDLTWVGFDHTAALLFQSGIFHGVQTELFRRVNDRTSLGGEYAIRVVSLNSGARHLTFQNVGAAFRYDTGPRTSIHAAAGLAYLIDRSLNESHTGPYVRADITHHIERATLGAGYGREFVPTFGFGGSSQSEAFHAFVTMPISRNRIYLQQSVSWQRSDPLIVVSPELDSWWLHSTVGYAMSRWLRAEGYYAFSRQDSSIPGGLIHRNRVGAQIAISQPVRIQ
jgi:hypothetical protein